MKARIHRGAQQVGGTCVELEASGDRILLDLGMPLDAEDGEAPLPDVSGLTRPDPGLKAAFITHLHGDHCGLVPFVAEGLPIAIGGTAARILREAEFFTGRPSLPDPAWELRDREALQVGAFRITPFQVEHSAFDAFALLVEANGRRLFYTGDFRAHGNEAAPYRRLLEDPPRDIHALLLEGTQIGDGREGSGPSEEDLRRTMARRFTEWPGLVLGVWSSQNIDRLRTAYEAAREAGRTLAIDLYTATLAKAARAPGVPMPGEEGLQVYCRQRERIQVKEAGEFRRTREVYRWRLFPEQIPPRASELVLMFRPSMLRELKHVGALPGALVVWSMWRGYLEQPAERRMRAELASCGVPVEVHHVSGHAYVRDLQRLVAAIQPEHVVPIHTENPQGYDALFPAVEVRRDGEWWEV